MLERRKVELRQHSRRVMLFREPSPWSWISTCQEWKECFKTMQ